MRIHWLRKWIPALNSRPPLCAQNLWLGRGLSGGSLATANGSQHSTRAGHSAPEPLAWSRLSGGPLATANGSSTQLAPATLRTDPLLGRGLSGGSIGYRKWFCALSGPGIFGTVGMTLQSSNAQVSLGMDASDGKPEVSSQACGATGISGPHTLSSRFIF